MYNLSLIFLRLKYLLKFISKSEYSEKRDAIKIQNKYNRCIKRIAKNSKAKKKILLVSHDFTLTGAPLAVFNTAKYLKNAGYEVVVIGFAEGGASCLFEKNGINAFASKEFTSNNERFVESLSIFDFVFANTVLSFDIVNLIYKNKPYLWRISEGSHYINEKTIEYNSVLKKVPKIHAVSKYTQNILMQFNKNVDLLLYGIEDKSSQYLKDYDKNSKFKKLKICVIGCYCERKAQDLMIQAHKELPKEIADRVEIFFIGGAFNGIESSGNIHLVGELYDDEKYKTLAQCDVLFCPSLDDPNPQVVMEAMMLKKPCVITENVGQKDYITDGVDGFVIKAGSVPDIKDKMEFLVKNPQIIDEMSPKSYELYKKYFTFENYINKVISIIEEKTK